jgi:threonine/homoserine/homoserine lactone efflux protein
MHNEAAVISDLTTIITSALAGFFCGLICSIPVGPVNLTIINEGPRRGFFDTLMIGFGASLMETIYCAIAFTGFASFFNQGIVKAAMKVFSFLFLTILGVKFLVAKSVESSSRVETEIEARVKPHSAFMKGFVRVLGNPGTLFLWIFISAGLMSRDLVVPTLESKVSCVLGVAAGTGSWFAGLSYFMVKSSHKLSPRSLLLMERGSGLVLLIFGIVQGCKIVVELARDHIKI